MPDIETGTSNLTKDQITRFRTWCYVGGSYRLSYGRQEVEILAGGIFDKSNPTNMVNILYKDGSRGSIEYGSISPF